MSFRNKQRHCHTDFETSFLTLKWNANVRSVLSLRSQKLGELVDRGWSTNITLLRLICPLRGLGWVPFATKGGAAIIPNI